MLQRVVLTLPSMFFVVLFGALSCAVLPLGGCFPKGQPTDPNLIKLVYWEHEDATAIPYLQDVIDRFLALPENKNVQIRRVHYGTEELRSQFQTAAIAGTAPDFITAPSDYVGVFSVAGFVQPMNPLFDLGLYDATSLLAVTLDGKTWGIPLNRGNHLMLFFNKKFVAKVPETTQELFEYCETTVKKKGLQNCLAFDLNEPFWLLPWLGAMGGKPLDEHTPKLDSPEMVRALTLFYDLKNNKKYVPNECDYNCMDTLFKEEKVPFIINGDWAISIYEKALKGNFGIGRIPKYTETGRWPSPLVSGKYFFINSLLQGEHLKATQRFVSFFTNEANQLKQAKDLGRLPALKAAALALGQVKDLSPLLIASENQLQVGMPMPAATEMRAVWDAMRAALGRVMHGKMTPEQGAQAMQADALSKIQEMNR